jgi:hypothetical protein
MLSQQSLQLHGCALPDWHGIDALNSLASLKALRFGAAPVTKEMGTGESRATVIARLPQLVKVSFSTNSQASSTFCMCTASDYILLFHRYTGPTCVVWVCRRVCMLRQQHCHCIRERIAVPQYSVKQHTYSSQACTTLCHDARLLVIAGEC